MAAVDSFQFLYREIARSCNSYFETLALVGALYTVSKAVVLMRDCCTLVRVHFIPRMVPSKRLAQRYGEWAVVYGASEAIGRAYAEELARRGISILFVGPDRSAAVSEAAAALADSYGVEALHVVADFTLGRSAGRAVEDAVAGRDVGFLVNCMDEALLAGPRSLIDTPEDGLWEAVSRDVAAATLLTRLVLPGMVERRRGAVVNISCGPCCRASLGRVALTASTGYLDNFSRALHHEYGHQGVFVQSLLPFQVASDRPQQQQSVRGGWLVPKPDVYVRHAISTLGISHRTTGYWPHTLQYGLVSCVPEWLWVMGSRMLLSST